jgi:hypothetical protein
MMRGVAAAGAQLACGVVPLQQRHAGLAVLVVVADAVVVVQAELAILARIDLDLRDRLLAGGRLDVGADRHDGTGLDEYRNLLDRRGHLDPASAAELFIGPVVVPVAPAGR